MLVLVLVLVLALQLALLVSLALELVSLLLLQLQQLRLRLRFHRLLMTLQHRLAHPHRRLRRQTNTSRGLERPGDRPFLCPIDVKICCGHCFLLDAWRLSEYGDSIGGQFSESVGSK